jgi:hypothetical protein
VRARFCLKEKSFEGAFARAYVYILLGEISSSKKYITDIFRVHYNHFLGLGVCLKTLEHSHSSHTKKGKHRRSQLMPSGTGKDLRLS